MARELDAVSIVSPTVTHHEIALFFLQQDVDVLVEKPMTPTLEEAKELFRLARQTGAVLHVGHVERFNGAVQELRKIVERPILIESRRLGPFVPRVQTDTVVMDLMIHDIDIVLGLVDSPIQDIQAVGVNVLTDLEDIANARLTFQNGCVCNLTASRVSDEVMRKIRIFLKDTYISLDYVKQEAFLYKKNGASISKTSLPIEKEEPLKKELESFLDCILQDTQPLVSGVEGRMALEVALKITQTLWKNPSI